MPKSKLTAQKKVPKAETITNPKEWIFEGFGFGKGRTLAIKVKKRLASVRSPFQKIDVIESEAYGTMMLIDGAVQFTDADEFTYHEMLAHVPINVKKTVENVLIVGGGDGGVAREVLKYPSVRNVDLCDIDKKVTDLSKKYFPGIACAFKDSRLHVFHEDGFAFLDSKRNEYDIIIVDSTDPVGFAENLFKKGFFQKVSDSLKPDGIMTNQLESMFYNPDIISKTLGRIRSVFPIAEYYYTMTPTYPSGTIGFSFASKRFNPKIDYNPKKMRGSTRYYNRRIHYASFCLPEFARKLTEE